jgi:uncharacterized protein (TIGR02266 family)
LLDGARVETPMNLVMPMVRIRLKCRDVDSFVDKYHADVNPAGIFVRTRAPLPPGTSVSFDFRLADDASLFRGCGVVVWSRADETLAPLLDPGMMLGFEELRDGTRENFARVLERKRALEEAAETVPTLVRRFAEEREASPQTKKMTGEEVEALRARMRADDDQTPLPPPRPGDDVTPTVPPPTALLVPSPPRETVEARPLPPADPPATPLAKILVLRPGERASSDGGTDPRDLPPPRPVSVLRRVEVAAASRPAGEITALVGLPDRDAHATRLLALALAGWLLLIASFVLVRLNVVPRVLQWLGV